MIEVPRSRAGSTALSPPGTWWKSDNSGRKVHERMRGGVIAMRCLMCEATLVIQVLSEGGTASGQPVDYQGYVTGPITCYGPGCIWRSYVRLLDWS
jgi:hypothetical protein